MNKWNQSTEYAYVKHFGRTTRPVVYEVGSRDGNDGVELARRIYDGQNFWHDADVILFECNPPAQKAIAINYPQATLVKEAVSNTEGKFSFLQVHGDKNFMGSSTLNLQRSDKWIKETSTIEVDTVRLKTIIKRLEHENTEIDVMKIDIEGFTYEALMSLGPYLANVKVFHLETEVGDYARNKDNLDIAIFMSERGYICESIEHEWGDHIQDQVWVRQ